MPNPASTLVGAVEELWRYPVKSMLGEQLTATEVTESGLLGDRVYALRDTSDGKIATAKNPRKWPSRLSGHPRWHLVELRKACSLPESALLRSVYVSIAGLQNWR